MFQIMSNLEIYNIQSKIKKDFLKDNYIPVGINFYIQKNINKLNDSYMNIETARQNIIKHYGTTEDGESYTFSDENKEQVQYELSNLENITQEVEIEKIPLSKLLNIEITTEQLQAIMFMIEDDVHEVRDKGEK